MNRPNQYNVPWFPTPAPTRQQTTITADHGKNRGFFNVPHTRIEQLRFLPLKARCFDCFFRPEQNAGCWKILDRVMGRMRFKKKQEEIPSIVMMQIFVPDFPEQSRKRQNSLFPEGLVRRINGHVDWTWHHTIINDDFLSSLPGVIFFSGRGMSHGVGQ